MREELSAITADARTRGPGLFIRGVAMGAADVVPGVSGGTVAFITGIYDELVGTLAGVNAGLLSRLVRGRLVEVAVGINAGFLIPLLAGVVTAIFTLAQLVAFLLQNHPLHIWGLLTGLMVASVVVVGRRVEGWDLLRVVCLAAGAGIGYGITIAVPMQTGTELYKFALSAAIASCAMILPGISGSFLLVLMGKYEQVLTAVHELDALVIATFAFGFAAGILVFSRLLKRLLANHHSLTMATLVGLMAGSMRRIWPFTERDIVGTATDGTPITGERFECVLPSEATPDTIASVALMVAGVVLVLLLDRLQHRGET